MQILDYFLFTLNSIYFFRIVKGEKNFVFELENFIKKTVTSFKTRLNFLHKLLKSENFQFVMMLTILFK